VCDDAFLKPLALRFGLAILFFFGLDAAVFRTGYYASILEPNSTAGYLQTFLWSEHHRQLDGPNQVLVTGDSRMPLLARFANSAATGYTFATIAVPGTSPRCWYYMLREVDPDRNRYAAIVLPANRYDDREYEDQADRELDIRYLTPLLRLGDLFEFGWSFPTWRNRRYAMASILLKGPVYQRDFQEFLVNHKWRIKEAEIVHRDTGALRYNAQWDTHSLAGMSVDWQAGKVELPEWMDAGKRQNTSDLLLRDAPPLTRELARYRRQWFGAIVARYRGTHTRLIVLRLARGPVVRPNLPPDQGGTLRAYASHGEFLLLDEHLFDVLERPELFGDALHMNAAGGERFSLQLAHAVRRAVGPPRGER
jgi:hypothetical protein